MQRGFRLYSVTVFVDFEVKRWLAFILSLITSFLLVLLCFCLSHFTDMMNVSVALQRVQSHQRVSSGHVRGRINNTKASKYNPGKNIFWHRRYSDLSESSAIEGSQVFPSSLLFKLMCFQKHWKHCYHVCTVCAHIQYTQFYIVLDKWNELDSSRRAKIKHSLITYAQVIPQNFSSKFEQKILAKLKSMLHPYNGLKCSVL